MDRRIEPLYREEQELLRKTLGHRCRLVRQDLGYSQRALAAAMDRSPSWVREIENGAQYAPPYLLKALSNASGQPISWFYGDDDLEHKIEHVAQRIIEHVERRLNT